MPLPYHIELDKYRQQPNRQRRFAQIFRRELQRICGLDQFWLANRETASLSYNRSLQLPIRLQLH